MIGEALLYRFPGDSDPRTTLRHRLEAVCKRHLELGLGDAEFERHICSDDKFRFSQRLSEALVGHELLNVGLDVQPSRHGPDLLVQHQGRKIWIEVVCPEPVGLPEEWLRPRECDAVHMPHEAILLRWTAAIKEKAEKLLGTPAKGKIGYLGKGIVGPNDAYVIAVNGVLLRSNGFPEGNGITQWPWAAEATLALGPYAVHIDRATGRVIGGGHTYREVVINLNGSPVPSGTFLDPAFSAVSAIFGVDFSGARLLDQGEPASVVHNPLAITPIPQGVLPASVECVASRISAGEFHAEKRPGRWG